MEPSIYFLAGNPKTDLGDSFDKLINATFTKYKGCLIEKVKDGYKALGKEYPTMEAAQNKIDNAFEKFNKC